MTKELSERTEDDSLSGGASVLSRNSEAEERRRVRRHGHPPCREPATATASPITRLLNRFALFLPINHHHLRLESASQPTLPRSLCLCSPPPSACIAYPPAPPPAAMSYRIPTATWDKVRMTRWVLVVGPNLTPLCCSPLPPPLPPKDLSLRRIRPDRRLPPADGPLRPKPKPRNAP